MADRDTLEIVRTIVTLARNLRMHVVAEGVETAEQLAQFRAFQCQHGQGCFFSEPLDGEAVVAWMGERVESLVAS